MTPATRRQHSQCCLLWVILAVCVSVARSQGATESDLDVFFGAETTFEKDSPPVAYKTTAPAPKTKLAESPHQQATVPASAPGTEANSPSVNSGWRYRSDVVADAGGAFLMHDHLNPDASRVGTTTKDGLLFGRRLLTGDGPYNHPVVTHITPTQGPLEGYTLITVHGVNFHDGLKHGYNCKFDNEVSMFPLQVLNSTHLTCRSARHEPGITLFNLVAPATNTFVEKTPDMTFEFHESLLVADYQGHRVLRYDARTGDPVDVFVEARSGGLHGPCGMAFGLDYNFYVASEKTSSVLQYNGSSGSFLRKFCTVHGQPRGLMFHYLDLFVTSAMYDRVYRYNGYTGSPRGVFIDGGPNRLDLPWAVLFDLNNNTFVSSQDRGQVYLYQQPVTGLYNGLNQARFDRVLTDTRTPFINGIALTVDSLYAVGPYPGETVVRYNRTTGRYMHHFEDKDLARPTDIQEFKDYLYVASQIGIRKYNRLNGEFIRTHVATSGWEPNTLLFHQTHQQNKGV